MAFQSSSPAPFLPAEGSRRTSRPSSLSRPSLFGPTRSSTQDRSSSPLAWGEPSVTSRPRLTVDSAAAQDDEEAREADKSGGDLSPGFDASFASSMSIGSPHVPLVDQVSPARPHLVLGTARHRSSSSPYHMDISPAPQSRLQTRAFTLDPTPAAASSSPSNPFTLPPPPPTALNPRRDDETRRSKSSDPFARAFAASAVELEPPPAPAALPPVDGRKTVPLRRSGSGTSLHGRPALFANGGIFATVRAPSSGPGERSLSAPALPAENLTRHAPPPRKSSDPSHLVRPSLLAAGSSRSSLQCPSRLSSYSSLTNSATPLAGPSPVEEEPDPLLSCVVTGTPSESDVSMMDIDSPGFAKAAAPHSLAAAVAANALTRPSRSTSLSSLGSIGKRTRLQFDDVLADGAADAGSPAAQDERLGAFFSSSPAMQATLRSLRPPVSLVPPESSSPSASSMSPTAAAASKLTLGRRAGERSLSGFLFPTRHHRSRSGSTGSPLGQANAGASTQAPPRRPGPGPVQSSASLFGVVPAARPRDASGRAPMKSRRAVSCVATAEGSLFSAAGPSDPESVLPRPVALASRSKRSANTWPKVSAGHHRVASEQIVMGGEEDADGDSPVRRRTLPPPSRTLEAVPQAIGTSTAAPGLAMLESPVGMGFSEKERAGKILPCHKVSSDGLMRITCETLDDLLEGRYVDRVSQHIVVDCRFAYEFRGGHVKGAINVAEKEMVEDVLLAGSLWGSAAAVPKVSESGKPDGDGEWRKTVLIFHCEFSAKRAPTVAKFLREQDRHRNMAHYPALHFPEIYILEGGYAKYSQQSPQHCEGVYVAMDDPNHRHNRHAELNQFRHREGKTFARAQSFTFGASSCFASSSSAVGAVATTLTTAAAAAPLRPVSRNVQRPLVVPTIYREEDDSILDDRGPEDSPCAAAKPASTKRTFLGAPTLGPSRVPLGRNKTVAVLNFGGSISSMR